MFALLHIDTIQLVTLASTALAMLVVGGLVVFLHFLRRRGDGRGAAPFAPDPTGATGTAREGEAAPDGTGPKREPNHLPQRETAMRLQWGPSPGQLDGRHHQARDEATGITAVVECDDPSGPQPWTWYLANYPVVSREPADDEGPAGRAPSREAAMAAAEQALPAPDESAGLLRRENELHESEQ